MERLPQPIIRDNKEYWYGTEESPFNASSIITPLGEDAEIIRADQDIPTSFLHLIERWRGQNDESNSSQLL